MIKEVKKFYKYFCADYSALLAGCLLLTVIAGFLEILGISSVIPLMQCIFVKHDGNTVIEYLLNATGYSQISIFIIVFIIIICAFIMKNILMIVTQSVTLKLIVKVRDNICIKFLKFIKTCEYGFFLKKSSNIFINTIDNTARYATTVFLFFGIQLVVNAITSIAIFCISLFLFTKITLISLAYFTICSLVLKLFMGNKIAKINANIETSNKENVGFLQNIMFSVKEIKILHTEDNFINKSIFSSSNVNYLEQLGFLLQTIPSFIIEILAIFLFCLITVYFWLTTSDINATVANIGVFAVIGFRIAPIINRLLTAFSLTKAYKNSVSDLNTEYEEMVNNEIKHLTSDNLIVEFKDLMCLKNACYSYDGATKNALECVDLSIEKNEFIGIVGLSGAGKTTLIDVILGLLKLTKGKYLVDDVEIVNHNQLTACFGYVAQNPYIMTGTVAENIAFGRAIDNNKINYVMSICRLDEFKACSKIMEFGKNISGGQKQRIAIARAMYDKPSVLILDEVTSSLDIITENKISDVINSLKGKCTITSIAHRISTLRLCDRILYMKDGQIIADASFDALYKTSKEFKEMIDISNHAKTRD